MSLHFYELHEGATDLLTNALLVSETAHSGEEFAALVRSARDAVLESFEEDTLVEAVARELERSHGFTYIGDEKLSASMSVGATDEDTFLVETSSEFRSIVVELDRS
jgi:peptide subunit release factor 1 (eRF1)